MICTRCKDEKSNKDFHIATRRKDGSPIYRKYCNECYKKVKDVRNLKLRVELTEYKESLFCNKCSISFKGRPWICDFHHVDSKNKSFAIGSTNGRKLSFKTLMKEIEKCIPLCANCHRDVHNEI